MHYFPKTALAGSTALISNRSALLERAAVAYLARLERHERDRQDLEITNRNAERLNREAMDILWYQQIP
jgi:hypothetical protein